MSAVAGAVAVGGGSVVGGLLVRHKHRFARGADWLARSEAWWNRQRQAWLAAVTRAPLGPVEAEEDEPGEDAGQRRLPR